MRILAGLIAGAVLAGVGVLIYSWSSIVSLETDRFQLVIPDGILPNSVDPLSIDQFNNYFPGQMLFTQPLMASIRGELTSELIETFQYDKDLNRISLFMKANDRRPSFSDGQPITADDVAFAVARLAYARPQFPVLRFIKGLESWRSEPNALHRFPEGIQVSGDRIDITLIRPQLNPLFRLTLNVVSVIPRRCVAVETNQVTCNDLPVSGLYTEVGRTVDRISYERRSEINHSAPKRVDFYYPRTTKNLLSTIRNLDERSVVWLYDLDFTPEEYQALRSEFQIFRLAEAWFTGFMLNPKVKPFDDVSFRRWFVQGLQERIKAHHVGPTVYSQSLFPEIVPGFLRDEDFQKFAFSPEEVNHFTRCLKGFDLYWGIRKSDPPPVLLLALKEMAVTFQFKVHEPIVAQSSHSGFDSFRNRQVALQTTNSGFWPLDPAGDIQMLLTPHLHEDYRDVWTDSEFNRLMKTLAESTDPEESEKIMRKINHYLHDRAIFNVFSHYGYFYARRPRRTAFVESGAVSLTVPYPWQVFGNE